MNQKLNNTCIKCESVEHGAEIVKFYKDNGWDNRLIGTAIGGFYGVRDGKFDNYSVENNAKVLTLQEAKDLVKENQYPKVMWVANRHDFTDAIKRVVFAHKCDRFIAWNGAETIEDAEKVVATMQWEYAKDIEEETEFQTKTRERITAIERELEELKKLIK